MEADKILVEKIASKSDWSKDTASVCLRAGFRCEYCGLDFLASPDNYKQIQVDHIVPKHTAKPDDPDNLNKLDNLAASCRTCNVSWKSRWDPRADAGYSADRDELIQACVKYIRKKRRGFDQELSRLTRILYEDVG